MKDFLIVGYGVAGCMLSYFLKKSGFTFQIIDQSNGLTSSKMAAGLINPITGRRYIKSWMIDELLPFAENTYQSIQDESHVQILQKKSILKVIHSIEQENDFYLKKNKEDYSEYLPGEVNKSSNAIINPYGTFEIQPSLQVNSTNLLETFSQKNKGQISNESLNYDLLNIEDSYIQYKDFKAKNIIFCEGFKAVENPLFKYLPFNIAKGEVLIIECDSIAQEQIISSYANLIPIGENKFWVGSTYNWKDQTLENTNGGKKELVEKLEKTISCPYRLLKHLAGVRPTVKDRRPFIGNHPNHKNVFIFNGMGTKGFSLSPYFANHFVEVLKGNEKLMPQVDIKRVE